ncbi:hypothetical protein L2E82_35721 [Cichorium intybus]|uniref:Uncharacterized protein n=1 Tax=Cichorium intybus TaxID=13427 RepID=A0ACB9BPJ5_CICIN|nr:hypothetical protein L2E82_35721 [Cichorium intybus]
MKFGKVLEPLEIIPTCQDLSFGSVCVLTRHKRRINEEVQVVLNGNVFGVGVLEGDYDWSPFPSGPFQSIDHYESGDEDDWPAPGDEEESEPDDHMGSSNNDKEDSEINSEDESDWVPELEATMPETVKNAVAGDTNNVPLTGVDDQTADEADENRGGVDTNSSLNKLNEAEIIVEVGKLLGIEMEAMDPVLMEALGEAGDHIGNL